MDMNSKEARKLVDELSANDMRRLAIYNPRIAQKFRDVICDELCDNNINDDDIQAIINMR